MTAAVELHRRGWPTFPLPAGKKYPPPAGRTGAEGVDATADEVAAAIDGGNVGIRMPAGVVGLDVDDYGDKHGAGELEAFRLAHDLPHLPASPVLTSRPGTPSGIRLFRIPEGAMLKDTPVPGVEIIQRHHRYALAPGSVHPEGRSYVATLAPGPLLEATNGEVLDVLPFPDELPDLPHEWVEACRGVRETQPGPTDAAAAWENPTGHSRDWSSSVARVFGEAMRDLPGSRHPTATVAACALARLDRLGHAGTLDALERVRVAFAAAVVGDGTRTPLEAAQEWAGIVRSARAKVAATTSTATPAEPSGWAETWAADANLRVDLPEGSDDMDGPTTGETWRRIDLGPIVDGTGPTETRPTIGLRTDGKALLYPSKVHSVVGEPESAKSWAAIGFCADEIRAGHDVLYIDFEDTGETAVARLRALGVDGPDIVAHFHYIRPDEPFGKESQAEITAIIDQYPPTLAVIDSMSEALAVHGYEIASNDDITRFIKRLPRWLADRGPAVLIIDHVTKAKDDRGRWPLGAQAKLAAIDVCYRVEVRQAFGRGKHGICTLKVSKDRSGFVRAYAGAGDTIADMHLKANGDGSRVRILLRPPAGGTDTAEFMPTHLMARASSRLEALNAVGEHPTKDDLTKDVKGNNAAIKTGIDQLIQLGHISRDEHRHLTLLAPYVEPEEDDDEDGSE